MDKKLFLFVFILASAAALQSLSLAATDPVGRMVWVDGPSAGDTAGVYSSGGPISARKLPAAWTGPLDSLFLFGGEGAPGQLFCDFWKKPPTGVWAPMTTVGTSTPNTAGIYPASFGTCAGTCYPGCRKDAATWVDPATSTFYLFGGYGYDSVGTLGLLNDVWSFNPTTTAWSWLSGSKLADFRTNYHTSGAATALNNPGGRRGAATGATNGQLWLHGGTSIVSVVVPDPPVPVPMSPPPVAAPVAAPVEAPVAVPMAIPVSEPIALPPSGSKRDDYFAQDEDGNYLDPSDVPECSESKTSTNQRRDAADSDAIVDQVIPVADTWHFDVASGNWYLHETNVAGLSMHGSVGAFDGSSNPGPRSNHVGFYASGAFWVFGGFGTSTNSQQGFLNDLFSFNSGSSTWAYWAGSGPSNVSGSSTLPSSRGYVGSWIGNNGNLWLIGGYGTDSNTQHDSFMGDVWNLNVGTKTFSLVSPVGSTAGSLATCSGGGAGCGLTPNYGTVGVSAATNAIGPRRGMATFHQVQSNQGLIFGGYGFDVSNSLHLLQDTWTIQSVPPTPTLNTITTLPALTASTATGRTATLTGTYFGYRASSTSIALNLGMDSISPTALSFTSLTFTSTSTNPTSAGRLTAVFTSEWGVSSTSIAIATVSPVLNSASLTFSADSFTSFTVSGLAFGSSSTPLSNSIIRFADNNFVSCNPTAVSPTSLICSHGIPTATSAGPLTLNIQSDTDITTYSGVTRIGSISPFVAVVSSPPSYTALSVPGSFTIAGNGFGTDAAKLSVSISFAGSAGRSCTVQASPTPTSLTCTLGSTTNIPAGTFTATVTMTVSAENFVSNTRIIGSVTPTLDTVTTPPVYGPNTIPSSITLTGMGFSTVLAEMSVSLRFPDLSIVTCTPTSSSLTSVTCTNPTTAFPGSGMVLATVTRTYQSISYSTSQNQIFRIGSMIDSTPIHISASATTVTVTGAGLALSVSLTFSSTSATLPIPTCTIVASSSQVTCTLSSQFVESLTYTITIRDNSGGEAVASNILFIHPVITAQSTVEYAAIEATAITVAGFGFGPLGTTISVTLGNSAACTSVTASSPTSFVCTLTSPATVSGSFSMAISIGGRIPLSATPDFARFYPTLKPSSTLYPAVTPVVLTFLGGALDSNVQSIGGIVVTGNACGVSNTCTCTKISASGTSLTCELNDNRSSGSMTARLTVGSYPASQVNAGKITPTITPSAANLVSTATNVVVSGLGLGLYPANVAVQLDSGACSVTSVNINTLVCTFSAAPTPGQALNARFTVNDAPQTPLIQIANCLPPPVITSPDPLPKLSVGATFMTFAGANFGDTVQPSVTLTPAPARCDVSSYSSTSISCTVYDLPSPGTTLSATVTKDRGSNLIPGAIFSMVALPTVTTVTTAISLSSTVVPITGSNFGSKLSDVSVSMTLNGNPVSCTSIALASTTSIQCTVASLPEVGTLFAVVTVAGGSSTSTQVAVVAIRPTINSNQGELALTATSVTISGTGFYQVGQAKPATITFSVTAGATPVCTNPTAISDTALSCSLTGGPFTASTLSVTSCAVNGLSTSTALPLAVYTLRDLPFINLKRTPAYELGTTNGLVFTGSRFAGSSISVQVFEAGTLISGYCNPFTYTTPNGVDTITCNSARTWNTVGPISAIITSSGIPSSSQIVGFVRGPPVINVDMTKLGSRATTRTITGIYFAFVAAENVITLTGGSSGTLPISAPIITSSSPTSITMTFTNTGPLPTGPLYATIKVAEVMAAGPIQIATIVNEPSPNANTRSISIDDTSVVITGSSLSFDLTSAIELVNSQATVFPCSSVNSINSTALRCNFAASQLQIGSVLVKTMVLDGVAAIISPAVQVALALNVPQVTENLQFLQQGSLTLVLNGANFSPGYDAVVSTSSGDCRIQTRNSTSITCILTEATIESGPIVGFVTVERGVRSTNEVLGKVRPFVKPSETRTLITRSTITITGSYFSSNLSKNHVVLTTTWDGLSQDCTATSVSPDRATLTCVPTRRLYAGALKAMVNVTGSDGAGYASDAPTVTRIIPVLDPQPIYANVSAGEFLLTGKGFEGSSVSVQLSGADGVPLNCLMNSSSWDSLYCWPWDEENPPRGGVYSAVVTVNLGTGSEASPAVSALAVAPVISVADDVKRGYFAVQQISTDTKSMNISGTGFDPTPARNLVMLSSGLCSVTAVGTDYLTCLLSGIGIGTLNARVSTNSVRASEWAAVANVIIGGPITDNTPNNRPAWNSSTIEGGVGPTNRKTGWTGGAIAGLVLACIFSVVLLIVIILAYFVFKRDSAGTAERLMKATRKRQLRRSKSSKNSSSASMSIGPSKRRPSKDRSKSSKDRSKDRPNISTHDEDEFIKKIIFAGAGNSDDPNAIQEYSFDSSSSEYLFRSSSAEESEEETDSDGTDSHLGSDQDQDGPSVGHGSQEEDEEYLYTSSSVENSASLEPIPKGKTDSKSVKRSTSKASTSSAAESKSSEYLYTSSSGEEEEDNEDSSTN